MLSMFNSLGKHPRLPEAVTAFMPMSSAKASGNYRVSIVAAAAQNVYFIKEKVYVVSSTEILYAEIIWSVRYKIFATIFYQGEQPNNSNIHGTKRSLHANQ